MLKLCVVFVHCKCVLCFMWNSLALDNISRLKWTQPLIGDIRTGDGNVCVCACDILNVFAMSLTLSHHFKQQSLWINEAFFLVSDDLRISFSIISVKSTNMLCVLCSLESLNQKSKGYYFKFLCGHSVWLCHWTMAFHYMRNLNVSALFCSCISHSKQK